MASSTDVSTIDWAASARTLFDQSDAAMFIFQPQDLKLVELNSRAEVVSGLRPSDLASTRIDQLLDCDDGDLLADLIDACRNNRTFEVASSIRLCSFGRPTIEIRVQVGQIPAAPAPLGLLVANEIPTKLSSSCAPSSQHDSSFKQVIDDIDAIVWEADLPYRGMTYVSNQLEVILGYSVESWLEDPRAWENSILEEDRERSVNYCHTRSERAEDHDIEYRAIAADGRILWIHDRVRVVTDGSGTPAMLRGVMIDITQRKQAQQDLANRESQFRSLVDHAPLCIHSVDINRNLSSINPAGAAMLGVQDPAEVIGREYMSFIQDDEKPYVQQLLDQAYQGIESDYEFTCIVNGEGRQFKSNFIPIADEDGVVCKVIGTTEDVTERDLADTRLRKSEHQFRQLAENINAVFWMQSIDGSQQYVSPKYDDIWGRESVDTRDPLQSLSNAIHHEDRDRREDAIRRLRNEEAEFDMEYRINRPDGQQRWIRDRGFVIRDESGAPTGIAGLAEDITNANATMDKLRIQDRAIAVAKTGIVIADARRENIPIIYCNEAFEQMTGYTRDEAIGRNCSFVQAQDTNQAGAKILRDAVRGGQACSVVMRNYRKDGTMFWNEVSVSPVHDAAGCVTHFVGFWNDISERVSMESRLRDSEHRFRTLTMHVPLGIMLNDVDGRCIFVNETCTRIVGQPRDICLGTGWVESLHPDDKSRIVEQWEKAELSGSDFESEARFLHADGTVVWAQIRSNPRISDRGEIVGYVGSLVDITEQKKTHAELEQSEQRFRTIVENAPEAIVVFDVDQGCFAGWNQKAIELYKTDEQTIKESEPWDFCPPSQPDGRSSEQTLKEFVAKSLAGENPVFDFVNRDSLGNDVACEIRLTRLPAGDRNLVRGSITDVTDRRSAEEQLRRTRLAVESTSDAVFVIDQHGNYVDVNQTACDRLGYSRDELLRLSVSDVNKRYVNHSWFERFHELREKKKMVVESEYRAKDGTLFPVEISKSFACVGGAEFAFDFVRDITTRKQSQARLQSTQFAVDQNVCAIVQISSDGRLTYVNDAACRGLQYSRDELLAKSIWDIDSSWTQAQWEKKWAELKQAGSLTTETNHIGKNGNRFNCEATACHVRFGEEEFVFAFYVDIRERKHAQSRLREREAQLAEVSRFSMLGEMVAGIAHEVNQPLYSILNYSKATKNNLSNPSQEGIQQVLRWNEQVKVAATRAGSIIKRLRGFVSQEPPNVGPVDIESVVSEAVEIVSYELKRAGVALRTEFNATHAVVRVDAVQTQQVVVNLLVNAIEAMERADSAARQITVGTTANAEFVEVFIADTGPGFPEQQPERNLFDAFVSTKPGGMGMGLAISKTIIESYGGRLSVARNELNGATFTFRLSPYGERRDV